jgi:hypothetical protein
VALYELFSTSLFCPQTFTLFESEIDTWPVINKFTILIPIFFKKINYILQILKNLNKVISSMFEDAFHSDYIFFFYKNNIICREFNILTPVENLKLFIVLTISVGR